MFKRFTISAFSLLCVLGSVAKTPHVRVMQKDNFPTSKSVESPVRTRFVDQVQETPAKTESDRTTYPVNIKIIRGPLSRGIEIGYFDESGFDIVEEFQEDEETGIVTVNLPEGTMDLIVIFSNMYINWDVGYFVNRGISYYFIEDVEVNANTPELKADANECTMLPLSFVMANGEPLEFGTQNWNGSDMETVSQGNCLAGGVSSTFYNSKYQSRGFSLLGGGIPTYYTNFGLDKENDNPMSYLIPSCNHVSDRWAFVFKFHTFTTEMEGGYLVLSLNPSSSPVTVTKADYNKKLEWNFSDTDVKGIEYDFGIGFGDTGNILGTISLYRGSEPLNIKAAVVNCADCIEDLSLMSQTKCALRIDDSDPSWPEFYGISEPPANTNQEATYFHPATYLFTAKPWTDDTKYREYLHEYAWGNEYANYSQSELAMKFGNSTPFLASNVWRMEDYDTKSVTGFSLSNYIIDLAGTFRSDWDQLESEVYFNGNLVKGKDVSLDEFQYLWNSQTEGLGKMKYVLTDKPDFRIEGMQPINTTEITYDQALDSWEPPTITSLLFKNSENKVTNCMADGKDAYLEVYAGGTKWNQYWYYHPYAERYFSQGCLTITGDVTPQFEYAACGSDNWQTLDAIENEDEYSQAYGNHYRVDLGKVTAASANGWYDLRVTLTTPEGNSQIQTLSPAFKFTDMAGVDEIFISNDEDSTVLYYDLQGMPVNTPAPGQIVIKANGKGAEKIRF